MEFLIGHKSSLGGDGYLHEYLSNFFEVEVFMILSLEKIYESIMKLARMLVRQTIGFYHILPTDRLYDVGMISRQKPISRR